MKKTLIAGAVLLLIFGIGSFISPGISPLPRAWFFNYNRLLNLYAAISVHTQEHGRTPNSLWELDLSAHFDEDTELKHFACVYAEHKNSKTDVNLPQADFLYFPPPSQNLDDPEAQNRIILASPFSGYRSVIFTNGKFETLNETEFIKAMRAQGFPADP